MACTWGLAAESLYAANSVEATLGALGEPAASATGGAHAELEPFTVEAGLEPVAVDSKKQLDPTKFVPCGLNRRARGHRSRGSRTGVRCCRTGVQCCCTEL